MKFSNAPTKTMSKLKTSYDKGSNVKTSRLNAGSDEAFRGKRGGAKKSKKAMSY